MMCKRKNKIRRAVVTFLSLPFLLTGCVDQSTGSKQVNAETARIVATSPAVAEICDKLDLDLVGICSSSFELPSRYAEVTSVGTAMSPDVEILASLQADWILSPVSLQSDLQPKYEALGSDYAFLNLRSVKGMYQAITELGTLFGREEEAQALVEEFTDFYEGYQSEIQEKDAPTVMILMGLPGSYVIATEHSYVGSLVELAGGQNVYAGTDQEFLTVNTEDMKLKDPDIILCTSHILPDQVSAMFADEFQTNDIWQHFRAVQDGEVYALTHGLFGMSANFQYQEALQELQQIFYGDEVREETEK